MYVCMFKCSRMSQLRLVCVRLYVRIRPSETIDYVPSPKSSVGIRDVWPIYYRLKAGLG